MKTGILTLFAVIAFLYPGASYCDEVAVDQDYLNAYQAFQGGDYGKARDLLIKISRTANVPEVHNLLGAVYDRLSDWSKAKGQFEKALILKPDYVDARYNFARSLEKQGNFSEAIFHLEKLAEVRPVAPEILSHLGHAYFALQEYQKSIDVLQRIEEGSPLRNRDFYLTLGTANERLRKVEAAEENLKLAMKVAPDDWIVQSALARVYMVQLKRQDAISLLRSAVSTSRSEPELHALLAEAYLLVDDVTSALSEYELASKFGHNAEPYSSRLATLYFKRADYQRSIATLETIPGSKRNDEHFNLLGSSYAKIGKFDEARRAFEQAIQLAPGSINPRYNLGLLFIKQGSYEQAVRTLNEGLDSLPKSPELLQALATALQLKGEFSAARNSMKQLVALQPESAEAHLYLGSSYLESGENQPASVAFKRAHELKPDDFRTNYFLGLVSLNANQFDEAAALFGRSAQLKPDFAFAHHQLAKIHLKRGDLKQALDECQKGIQADATLAPLQYLLAQVYARMNLAEKAQEQLNIYQQVKAAAPEREYRVFAVP